VARHYRDLLDGFVLDQLDADQAAAIEALGVRAEVAQTVMKSTQDRIALADGVLGFARRIA